MADESVVPDEFLQKLEKASPESKKAFYSRLAPVEAAHLEEALGHRQKLKKTSALSSLGTGVEQGATLGYADEADAGLKALGLTPGEATVAEHFPPALPALAIYRGGERVYDYLKGNPRESMHDAYYREQKKNQEDVDLKEQANPKTFMTGKVLGGAATLAATGGAGSVPGILAEGAGIGLAQGVGESHGALFDGDERRKDLRNDAIVGVGAGLAGATLGKAVVEPVAKGVAKGVGWAGQQIADSELGQGAKQFAKDKMFKAMNPMLKHFRNFSEEERNAIADEALNVSHPGISAHGIEEKLEPVRAQVNKEINDVVDQISGLGQAQDKKLGSRDLAAYLREKYLPTLQSGADSDKRAVAEQIVSELEGARGKTPTTFKQSVKETRGYQDRGHFDQATPARTTEAIREASGKMKDKVELDALGIDQDKGQQYIQLKKRASNLIPASEIAQEGAFRQMRNRNFSPSDYGVAAAEALNSANPVYGGIAGILHKVARERGNSFLAVTTDRLMKSLGSGTNGEAAGAYLQQLAQSAVRGHEKDLRATLDKLKKDPAFLALVNSDKLPHESSYEEIKQ